MEISHFSHVHPLVFGEIKTEGISCFGCGRQVLGPSYSCRKCKWFCHHKSCAELPYELSHPLHRQHSLQLFHEKGSYDVEERSRCVVCKELHYEFAYRCSIPTCDFILHSGCAVLPLKAECHDHELTPIRKWITFTCDLCGKNGEGMPNLCVPCGFWIHKGCASFPKKIKVIRHKHHLDLTHSFEVHQSNIQSCRLCSEKVDKNYGNYHCSSCNFVAHLDCAKRNEDTEQKLKDEESTESKTALANEDLEINESTDMVAYKVKTTNMGEDGIEIATEIEHFSHEHDLKLIDEVHYNEKCDGCMKDILSPFYSCEKCCFFLHKSCADLPRKKRHPLHPHSLTLLPKTSYRGKLFWCHACDQGCNGFTYNCEKCKFDLDVQCSLISDILTHPSHAHCLDLSTSTNEQNCHSCNSKGYQLFRCTICEFAVDFKCATLPQTRRYGQQEPSFTLHYTAEDETGEYYCDICEEKRDPELWFYYCADFNYPAHPKCILGKYPNCKFGCTYSFDCHPHPLTFVEKAKDYPQCHKCSLLCKELIYQCTECNFNSHYWHL